MQWNPLLSSWKWVMKRPTRRPLIRSILRSGAPVFCFGQYSYLSGPFGIQVGKHPVRTAKGYVKPGVEKERSIPGSGVMDFSGRDLPPAQHQACHAPRVFPKKLVPDREVFGQPDLLFRANPAELLSSLESGFPFD